MPGLDKKDKNGCGPTHSHACDCREAIFEDLLTTLKTVRTVLGEQMSVSAAMLEAMDYRLKGFPSRSKSTKAKKT